MPFFLATTVSYAGRLAFPLGLQETIGRAFLSPRLNQWPRMHLGVMLTRQLCLWSPRGHGRVGLVGAVLLGRLYGCTADDALLRVQVRLRLVLLQRVVQRVDSGTRLSLGFRLFG